MSEMKTLKFPGDAEPREIVDAKARVDISKLSEENAKLKGDLDSVEESVYGIGDYITGAKIATGYKLGYDGEVISDVNRKIVAFPVTDKIVYAKTKYGYQFRAGQSVGTKLYTRIGEFSGFVSIPDGVTYLAVDMDIAAEEDYGCYDVVDVVSNMESELSNKVDNKYFIFERTPQLFDKHNPCTIDAYFDSSKIMGGTNFKSFYIPIDNSKTQITVNRGTAGSRFSIGFTNTIPQVGVSVSGYVNKNSAISITTDIPSNANYLIVWFYNSSYDTRTVEEMLSEIAVSYGSTAKLIPYTVLSFEFDKAYESLKEYIKSPLVGKKMNCFGDSFTDDSISYEFVLKNRLSELTTVHVARGGSAIVTDYDSAELNAPSFLSRMDGTAPKPDGGYYTGLSTDADITVIMGGINDCRDLGAGTITMGNIDSAHDTTTFYGGMQLLIDRMIEMIPNQYILGVIPPSFNPSAPYTTYIGQVQTAEREIYRKYRIPFVDLAYDCFQMSDNPTIMALYRKSVSGTTNYHPNENGHEAIAGMIQGKLESLIR